MVGLIQSWWMRTGGANILVFLFYVREGRILCFTATSDGQKTWGQILALPLLGKFCFVCILYCWVLNRHFRNAEWRLDIFTYKCPTLVGNNWKIAPITKCSKLNALFPKKRAFAKQHSLIYKWIITLRITGFPCA